MYFMSIRPIGIAPVCTCVHYYLCQNRGPFARGSKGVECTLFRRHICAFFSSNYTLFVLLCALFHGSTPPTSRPSDRPDYYIFSTCVNLLTYMEAFMANQDYRIRDAWWRWGFGKLLYLGTIEHTEF